MFLVAGCRHGRLAAEGPGAVGTSTAGRRPSVRNEPGAKDWFLLDSVGTFLKAASGDWNGDGPVAEETVVSTSRSSTVGIPS